MFADTAAGWQHFLHRLFLAAAGRDPWPDPGPDPWQETSDGRRGPADLPGD
jgi:hypothetical protein